MAGLNIITHYSALMCDHLDAVIGYKVYDAPTDRAALAAARCWLGTTRAVEIWQGPRLVGRYPPKNIPIPPGQAADDF